MAGTERNVIDRRPSSIQALVPTAPLLSIIQTHPDGVKKLGGKIYLEQALSGRRPDVFQHSLSDWKELGSRSESVALSEDVIDRLELSKQDEADTAIWAVENVRAFEVERHQFRFVEKDSAEFESAHSLPVFFNSRSKALRIASSDALVWGMSPDQAAKVGVQVAASERKKWARVALQAKSSGEILDRIQSIRELMRGSRIEIDFLHGKRRAL